MNPSLFALLAANGPLQGLLGTSPFRFYPAADAPQDVTRPYATYMIAGGSPENYLGDRPDMDMSRIQVDVYAPTAKASRELAQAIRTAVETRAHVVSFKGEVREPDTKLIRVSFDLEWFEST